MDALRFRRQLALRFLRAAGLVALAPSVGGCAGDEACFRWSSDQSCPAQSEALGYMQICDADGCITSVDSDATLVEGDCCYDVTVEEHDSSCGGTFSGGCVQEGRPIRIDGVIRTADATRGASRGWVSDTSRPDTTGLSRTQRAMLAEAYAASGLMEHASVACFSRLALELMAAGAPALLVSEAHRAALDEVEHARACFSLASAYAGEAIEPGPIDLGGALAIDADLASIAVAAVREGCVGETLASVEAKAAAASTTDGAVRALLERIADDEGRHAELAWRVVAWTIDTGGERVRAAVRAAFGESCFTALPNEASLEGADRVALERHGRLSASASRAAHVAALREIVRPCARALLARGPRPPAGIDAGAPAWS